MDEALVRRARAVAQESLSDMPPAGIVGLAAFSEVARLLSLLEKLDAKTAPDALAQLQTISKDLDSIASAFDKGLHKDALAVAFGRFATVAEGLARGLSEAAKT